VKTKGNQKKNLVSIQHHVAKMVLKTETRNIFRGHRTFYLALWACLFSY